METFCFIGYSLKLYIEKTNSNYTDTHFFGKISSTTKRRTQDVNYYHWFPTFG